VELYILYDAHGKEITVFGKMKDLKEQQYVVGRKGCMKRLSYSSVDCRSMALQTLILMKRLDAAHHIRYFFEISLCNNTKGFT